MRINSQGKGKGMRERQRDEGMQGMRERQRDEGELHKIIS